MKNNIDFYKHYSNADQHPKFKMLRVEYGWNGEGKFWALNNRIALSEDCLLDITKKYIKSGIASDLNLSLSEFDTFINFLLNECELIFEDSPGIITTDIIQETLSIVVKKRKKNKSDYKTRLKETERICQLSKSKIQTSENIHSTSTSTSIKEEKKKIKKKTPVFSPPSQQDVINYFLEKGYSEQSAIKAFNYYEAGNWKDSTGKQVQRWKQKMIGVWFKDENKAINKTKQQLLQEYK